MKIIEVNVENITHKDAEVYMYKNYNKDFSEYTNDKELYVCYGFVVDNVERINIEVNKEYISVYDLCPELKKPKNRVKNNNTTIAITIGNKNYSDFACTTNGIGTMYFVEQKNIIDVSY